MVASNICTNRWHYHKCRRGRRGWCPGRPSQYIHHKVQHGDRSRQLKQPKWLQKEIKIKDQRLEEVENFKYLSARISNGGWKPEILSRITQATAALSKLKIVWRDKNISLVKSWCGCSSYPPSFMPVRAGPWKQKLREGSKPLRWDAIGDFWMIPTKTMWRTRRFATESRMQLECMKIS